MRYLIYGLLFISSNTYSQDSIKIIGVKSWILSNLITETKTGRICDSLQTAQAKEIKTLGAELVATHKAIELQSKENLTLQAIVATWERESVLKDKVHKEEKRGLRRWLWRLGGLSVLELAFIVLLVL